VHLSIRAACKKMTEQLQILHWDLLGIL